MGKSSGSLGWVSNFQAMKTPKLLATALAMLGLCSCIPSVEPYYTADQAVVVDRLAGEWEMAHTNNEPHLWEFIKLENKTYDLTVTEDNNKKGEFTAVLFKLKENYFLDLTAKKLDFATNQADMVASSIIPGHLLLRVALLEPDLKLAGFDYDWLKNYLESHPRALAHHSEDGAIFLTAHTGELQGFVLKHLGKGELFGEPETLHHTKNVASLGP